MRKRYYQTSRLVHLLVSLCVLSAVILLLRIQWIIAGPLLIGGTILGYLLGRFDWGRTRLRIDTRNVVILYATDGGFYGLLLLLFLVQIAPRSIFDSVEIAIAQPVVVTSVIYAVCSCWCGHNLAYWRGARDFELNHGKLITKQFWSRSEVGQEGMISKEGVAIDRCDPSGKVQIGSEVWNAESIDRTTVEASDRVIVRDIDGLKLIVERITNA